MTDKRQQVLRVGVVWQGQLVVEQVLDSRIDLTVGTDPSCAVRLGPQLAGTPPSSVRVAVVQAGVYHAVLGNDTDLTLRGGQATAASHQARRTDGVALVPIENALGGSWHDGELTVLFQWVQPEAMVVEVREQTVLRLKLIHDGRELATRTLVAGERLRIGPAQNDDFVLPLTDYQGPGIRVQLGRSGGGMAEVPKSAGLRLARSDASPLDAEEALTAKRLRDLGSHWQVHLPLGARCRAALGPYVVLVEVRREAVVQPRLRNQPLHQRVGKWLLSDATWNVSLGATALVVGALALQAAMVQKTTLRFLQRVEADEPVETALYPVDVPLPAEPELPPEPAEKPAIVAKPTPVAEAPKPPSDDDRRLQAQAPKSLPPRPSGPPASAGPSTPAAPRNIADAMKGAIGSSRLPFANDDAAEYRGEVFGKGGGGGSGDTGAGPGNGPAVDARVGAGAGEVERIPGKTALPRRTPQEAEAPQRKVEDTVVKVPRIEPSDPHDPTADVVGRAVARKHGAVRRCYELALREQPGLSGAVRARFSVAADGGLDDVQVSSADPGLADCVRNVLQGIRGLPSAAAGQRYTQSYVFSKAQ